MPDSTFPATIVAEAAVAVLTAADQAAIHDYALAEKSAATWRACIVRTSPPLPHGAPAARSIQSQPHRRRWQGLSPTRANAGFRASTLGRRVAAIAYAHALAGLEPPTSSKAVRVVLGSARRKIGTMPTQKAPAKAEQIQAMLADLPETLTGKRNHALIVLGFAGHSAGSKWSPSRLRISLSS